MQNNKIIQLGDPQLRQKSQPVSSEMFATDHLNTISNSLINLMQENNGVGLAAPQIGISQQILVLGFEKSKRRPHEKPIPITVLINPEIFPDSNVIIEEYETCLSIGNGLAGKVPRYEKIFYRAFNTEGLLIEREVSGLHARIVQHEFDHLNGIVFLDRVQDSKTFGFYEELLKSGLI